jgi:spore maturation protein CgeB
MRCNSRRLRIFYAAGNKPNGSLNQSKVWYYNLYLPLQDLGHEIVQFDYDLEPHYNNADFINPDQNRFSEINRPKLEEALFNQISKTHKEKHIDIFFSYFYSSFVKPELIHAIKEMGILTINWYCNASYQFHLIEDIAPAYDYCLVPERYRLDDYRRIKANPIYCQEAANPYRYKPYSLAQIHNVTFVGSRYGDRAHYIKHLIDKGIDAQVWGPGWTSLSSPTCLFKKAVIHAKRAKARVLGKGRLLQPILPTKNTNVSLSDKEMIKMYSRSKISLGFSKVGETHLSCRPIKQVRLRDFEAPMSGAFYLAEYVEELEDFFDIGKEMICYFDKCDLTEKIIFYLKNESEREKIRWAGHLRAKREHTWQNRFKTVFEKIGV